MTTTTTEQELPKTEGVDLAAAERCVIKTSKEAQVIAADRMVKMGGSFMRSIGMAYAFADPSNQGKLVDAFGDNFVRYAKQAGAFPVLEGEGGAN